MMANVRAERLLKILAQPRAVYPGAAAQTRVVSMAAIRLDSRKSVRPFKGIICADVSEFESYMPSHAVGSLPANMPARLEQLAAPRDPPAIDQELLSISGRRAARFFWAFPSWPDLA